MTRRLAQSDLAEFRLRLTTGKRGGWNGIKPVIGDDVERMLDEIEECWDGNLPEWAGMDARTNASDSADYDDVSPLPHWAVKRIEESADHCEQIARALQNKGLTAAATVWREVEEELYQLAEEIESDEGIQAEGGQDQGCANEHCACERGADRASCSDDRDPGRPAPASRKRRSEEAQR